MNNKLHLPTFFTKEQKEHFTAVYNSLLVVEEVASIAYIEGVPHFLYLELNQPPTAAFFEAIEAVEKGPFKLEMVPVDLIDVSDEMRFSIERENA